MDLVFSAGKLEMAQVWKPSLNMQVRRAWVLRLTPLLRTARTLVASTLALAALLSAVEAALIWTATLSNGGQSLTAILMSTLECTVGGMVAAVICVARQHTSPVSDQFGLRSEMRWLLAGVFAWCALGVFISVTLPVYSVAWSLANHWRNSLTIIAYLVLTLHSTALSTHADSKDSSGNSKSSSKNGLPSVTLSLLRTRAPRLRLVCPAD